jgi:energy coupling factor transporter S component ThiW
VKTAKLSLSSILIGLGVALSFYPGPIPLGPALVFPFQSMINVLAGILLGPFYAALVAFLVGAIRITVHTGTIYSLPGGIPGALFVGYSYKLSKSYLSAFAEIPGTALVGALLSATLVAPATGSKATALFFVVAFTPPALIGSALGFAIMLALRRRGVVERLPL